MNKWFKRREVANFFGVSESTIKRWEKEGLAPLPRKINSRVVRYPPDTIDWMLAKLRKKRLRKTGSGRAKSGNTIH